MLRTAGWITLGVASLALGVIGLVVPIIPGILFLLIAALCLSAPFPRVHGRLKRHPAVADFRRRWRSGASLPWADRVRLGAWSLAETLMSPFSGRTRSNRHGR